MKNNTHDHSVEPLLVIQAVTFYQQKKNILRMAKQKVSDEE